MASLIQRLVQHLDAATWDEDSYFGTCPGEWYCPNDVPSSSQFLDAISWILGYQVAGGYPDGGYRPGALVSRQAMAQFLANVDEASTWYWSF
jgi:hypothetical protein